MTAGGAVERAAELAALGHAERLGAAERHRLRDAADDEDPRVRAAALGALVRADAPRAGDAVAAALHDPDPSVRRRAAELAPRLPRRAALVDALLDRLADDDVTVVEAACWALGELGPGAGVPAAVAALSSLVRGHRDPLAREAAVAALGALGDPAGLPAVLDACRDKPAIRRRAVLALAPFSGPEVEAALAAALEDRDWQVRQAAEDLLGA